MGGAAPATRCRVAVTRCRVAVTGKGLIGAAAARHLARQVAGAALLGPSEPAGRAERAAEPVGDRAGPTTV